MFLPITYGYGQEKCEVSNHYEDFISVEKSTFGEKDYLTANVVETDRKSCFSDLINYNTNFADYLLTNFSSRSNQQSLLQLSDSIALRNAYFSDLRKDSLFNSVMNELMSKTIDRSVPKDSVSMDKLLSVAVKYFSIRRLSEEGHYIGQVCVGANAIKKTEDERKPFIEAFAFSSIFKHYQSDEFDLYSEFVKAIKELYKVNLGVDNDEKLLRAQGAMFFLMRNNEPLKEMLKTEYDRQVAYLPFILIEE